MGTNWCIVIYMLNQGYSYQFAMRKMYSTLSTITFNRESGSLQIQGEFVPEELDAYLVVTTVFISFWVITLCRHCNHKVQQHYVM